MGFLLRVDSFPFTPNGKIDENALPMPELSDDDGVESPSGEKVLAIFKKVLRREELEASHDYFLAGGNSLNAMETIIEIEKTFGRRLRVADLYVYRTAAKLGAFLDGVSGRRISSKDIPARLALKKAEKKDSYPLTPLQQGMYVQSVLSPDSLSYNMPGALRGKGELVPARIEEAFRALVKKQRETARAARKDAGADAWKNAGVALNDIPATVFTGYTATEDEGKVLGIVINGESS